MPWPPEFVPDQKSSIDSPRVPMRGDPLDFIIGVVSDKGLSEIKFLINPKNFMYAMTQLSNPQGVRVGWSVEHAGQGLDQLSVSGTSAACYLNGKGLVTACNFTGQQHNTQAMRQINDLVRVFMDNGSVRNSGAPYVIDLVGHVYIMYDSVTYIGRFDELSIVEASERPYLVDFSFMFTVHSQHRS